MIWKPGQIIYYLKSRAVDQWVTGSLDLIESTSKESLVMDVHLVTNPCTLLLSHLIAITSVSRNKWWEWCCHKPRLVRKATWFTVSMCSLLWRKQRDRVSGTSALPRITNHAAIVPHSSPQHFSFLLFAPT